MAKKKLKIGVIGAGQIGLSHINDFNASKSAQVVAVAELHEGRRTAAAEQNNIEQAFADYKEMLAVDEIDAVSVALPNALHASVSLDAIKAGKHVCCDKPFATTYKDALKVCKAADGDGVNSAQDILTLIDALDGSIDLPPEWRIDMDRSGKLTPADITRQLDLFNGAESYEPFLGATLP